MDRIIPEKLPDVVEVTGVYFNPDTMGVYLQYKGEKSVYEICFPLEEILKSEEWFIVLRKHIGESSRARKGSSG